MFVILGTINATACPAGTYRDDVGGASLADCYPCPPGYYCADEGATGATGICAARYYCPDYAEITTDSPSNYECPAGFMCGNQTATPRGCDPGMHRNILGFICCMNLH